MKSSANILELEGICKQFSGIEILHSVDLAIKRGSIHALIGKNGAGKSSLAKIISGVFSPTSGKIQFEGAFQSFQSPADAQAAGISAVYQEITLLPELSIAENIYLGQLSSHSSLRGIDWKAIHSETSRLLKKIGLEMSPQMRTGDLSAAQQQMVQLARALKHNARLIVMDEPSARLTEYELERLFTIMKGLREDGVTIIYIGHRLEELERICDYVTVLRDGRLVATLDIKDTSPQSLSQLMLGRSLFEQFPERHFASGDECLRVQGLSRYGQFEDIDFILHRGEILGITGLIGSGGTALLQAIFGYLPLDEGEIYIEHRLAQIRSPRDAVAYGMGLLSEDQQAEGLVLDMGIGENVNLVQLELDESAFFINHQVEDEQAQYYIQNLQIPAPNPQFRVRFLSSGNQQKVIVSRWMAASPRILLCDEPTKGVDIAGKAQIYELMNELTAQNIAIVMVSSDVTEILNVCDRVLALRDGRPVCNLTCSETNRESILSYMMGANHDD